MSWRDKINAGPVIIRHEVPKCFMLRPSFEIREWLARISKEKKVGYNELICLILQDSFEEDTQKLQDAEVGK